VLNAMTAMERKKRMIERMKRLVQKHLILTYLLAYLIILCEFGCIGYLVFTNSDKTLWLAFPCILTAWIIAASEMIRVDEETRREAYLAAIRRINRLN
jgi:cell division protein FtsB